MIYLPSLRVILKSNATALLFKIVSRSYLIHKVLDTSQPLTNVNGCSTRTDVKVITSNFQLFRIKHQQWHNHFFQRNPSMLIAIPVITHIMIVIIDIGQEKIIFGKNIRTTHIYVRQTNFFWFFNRINIFILITEASSCFVTQNSNLYFYR